MLSTTSTPPDRSAAQRRTRFALFFYAMVLFMATHWPHLPEISTAPGFDKLEHLIAYAGLGLLLAHHFFFQWRQPRYVLALTMGVVGIFAALDELLQIPVGRQCDGWDWLADLLGAVLGGVVASVVVVARRRLKATAADARLES